MDDPIAAYPTKFPSRLYCSNTNATSINQNADCREKPMLQRIADSIILCPTRDVIRVEHKKCETLRRKSGSIDVWVQRRGDVLSRAADVFVLKFGGAGSRAERATVFPLDFWRDMTAEIWAPNWPGFGASEGQASVRRLAEIGGHCYEAIRERADGRPIIVTGNSLGTAVALAVAAQHRDMAGLILRNPPPLRQLIVGRHGWYSFWMGAWLISRCVPSSLDSIANARGSDVPALFITSGKDRVVPPTFQHLVFDAYAGPKQRLLLPSADHADFPDEADLPAFTAQMKWLRARAGLAAGTSALA